MRSIIKNREEGRMDQIIIRGLRIMARHGYTKEERIMEQEFELDIILYCDLERAMETDLTESTVDCAQVIKVVTSTLKETSYQLIERAAKEIIDALFDTFPMVGGIELALKKMQSGILADFDSVGVQVTRARSER